MNPPPRTQNQTQTPATRQAQMTVKDWISADSFKAEVGKMLPKMISPDYFIRVALNTAQRRADILDCTPKSVMACLLDCASYGLVPNGRDAHLIPFKDNKLGVKVCTLIIDYKGFVNIVRRSGEVAYIHADVVCENDSFDYVFGTGAFLKHKPALGERGTQTKVYSFVKMADGSEDFDVMSAADVERIRARSKSANDGPWVTDWDEMAKKSIFRRHAKWLPFSPIIQDAIGKDAEHEFLTEQERFGRSKPVQGFTSPASLETPQSTSQPASEPSEPTDERAESADGLAPERKPKTDKPAKAAQVAQNQAETKPEPSDRGTDTPEPANTPSGEIQGRKTIQDELGEFLTDAGVTFSDFCDWAKLTGRLSKDAAEGTPSFADLPSDFCHKLKTDTKALTHCINIYGKKAQ